MCDEWTLNFSPNIRTLSVRHRVCDFCASISEKKTFLGIRTATFLIRFVRAKISHSTDSWYRCRIQNFEDIMEACMFHNFFKSFLSTSRTRYLSSNSEGKFRLWTLTGYSLCDSLSLSSSLSHARILQRRFAISANWKMLHYARWTQRKEIDQQSLSSFGLILLFNFFSVHDVRSYFGEEISILWFRFCGCAEKIEV